MPSIANLLADIRDMADAVEDQARQRLALLLVVRPVDIHQLLEIADLHAALTMYAPSARLSTSGGSISYSS